GARRAPAAGVRARPTRRLGSVVEVPPEDVKAQGRLARLWRWAAQPALACRPLQALDPQHPGGAGAAVRAGRAARPRRALAERHPGAAARVVEAVRCARGAGQQDLAEDLLAAAEPKAASAIHTLLERPDPDDNGLRGDMSVVATWSGDSDLDLAIVDPRGQRVSWF